jgi:hypothetical protein
MMVVCLSFTALLFIATQPLADVSLNGSDEPILTHAATVVSTTTFSFGETTENERQNIANYGIQEFNRTQTKKNR